MEDDGVLVAGTGPAGLIAALAMSRAGFEVTLVGPPASLADGRTTALMSPAISYLEGFGVVERFRDEAAALRVMRIVDATGRLVRSPTVTFHASEIGEEAFGLNIPNRALNAALSDAVLADPSIDWLRQTVEQWETGPDRVSATLSDGAVVHARLAVAADGRNSAARQAAGIRTARNPFPQSAVVLGFSHTRPHGSVSTEFHTKTGPFTQVPLPGDRSSLVWVVTPAEAEDLATMDRAALSALIEEKMQSMLGKVTVETDCQVYPLSVTLPLAFARNRVALVGEAAHVFPPIGAQGLNLGIRDVEQLVETATRHVADPGSAASLAAYDARRRPDILARTGAVSLLNRSLLSGMLPAQLARGLGLSLLGAFSPLRAFFMREGLKPGSGFSSILSGMRKEIRR